MHDPRQDDDLSLSEDAGPCRRCGQRRVLCAHAWCRQCHHAPYHATWHGWERDRPMHLCCGWWGWAEVLPWQCLTCGTVRQRR